MSPTNHEYSAAVSAIEKSTKILITPHANVDPDGLSSALACYSVLTQAGKECTVVCPDTLPESLKFLPNFEKLTTNFTSEQQFIITLDCSGGVEVDKLRYTIEDNKVNIIVTPKKGKFTEKALSTFAGDSGYDLLLVVDTAELTLLGSLYSENVDFFSTTPILNIDHHISNTGFGSVQLIDPTAASATEVLYGLFTQHPQWKTSLNADTATLLLTGLITDTRSFQNPNTTPRSLEVAANLIDLGARQQEIIQHIYKTKPLSTLKIWGRALNRIQVDPESRIVWSSVSHEDLKEMEASSKETHGILDELISTVPNADVHVLFTELEEGGMKASVRSSSAIDSNRIAGKLFGGGGHARAAGFRAKSYANFQLYVIECIQKIKSEMKLQRAEGENESPAPVEPVAKQLEKKTEAPTIVKGTVKSTSKKSVDVVETLQKKSPQNKAS